MAVAVGVIISVGVMLSAVVGETAGVGVALGVTVEVAVGANVGVDGGVGLLVGVEVGGLLVGLRGGVLQLLKAIMIKISVIQLSAFPSCIFDSLYLDMKERLSQV